MASNNTIKIEVAYALPEQQRILTLEVEKGTTVEQAIHLSGMLNLFPQIDLTRQKVGIFSKQCELSHVLETGDRVEIYRPLTRDPKDARRARVRKK